MEAVVLPYGGILQRLTAPDRNGAFADVVLGFDDPESYRADHPYFGALGQFELDGNRYSLATNNGPNHLHGGETGFDSVE